jgi:uracil phosphoribosyltransferase
MAGIITLNHPLVHRDLTLVRNRNTKTEEFRSALNRIAIILAYHALQDIPLREVEIETPIQPTKGYELDRDVVVVPILRAGLSLVDALVQFVPSAKVGHLGMYRDEQTHEPVPYYAKLPQNISNSMVLLVDPMLATGGSADDAIHYLQKNGAKDIRFISLIASPEGIKRVQDKYPDVQLITAAVDEKLNDDAYIVPGLGDAGDRYFGTM